MSPAPSVPSLADRYRILRELGRGGMATVCLAEDLKHQDGVVINSDLYDNRFGTMLQSENGASYVYKTNIGGSETRGAELAVNAVLWQQGLATLSAFTATSYFDATYVKGSIVAGGANVSIVGNEVESAPRWISRTGRAWRRGEATAWPR